MTRRTVVEPRLRRAAAFALPLAALVLLLAGHHNARAAAAGSLTTEPVLRSAAAGVTKLFGATPAEAAGEVWGTGTSLVRYTDASGWEKVAPPPSPSGAPLTKFEATAGSVVPSGGVAVAAAVGEASLPDTRAALALRDPGGSFRLAPIAEFPLPENKEEEKAKEEKEGGGEGEEEPGEGAEGEAGSGEPGEGEGGAGEGEGPKPPATTGPVPLFGTPPLIAAVEEPGGVTGAFTVPPKEAGVQSILHYDGVAWTREEICLTAGCVTKPASGFRVVAIEATGPGNAWMLGEAGSSEDGVELFRREGGAWLRQTLGAPGSLGGQFASRSPAIGVTVTPRPQGDPLTVTADGVWVDAAIKSRTETFGATFYFDGAEVQRSWCDATGVAATLCTTPLGSELPTGAGTSTAWSATEAEPFGRRVITGVGQGAILSLDGLAFDRIPLAGGEAGTSYGAALSSPEEGWLGRLAGPLRITREPAHSSLAPWPVPFRRPLTAVVSAPGQPVGSLTTEAVAVGDQGQVARYLPGQGWTAEFLQNAAGVRATPRLRAVAWPEPNVAYAVGNGGAMWVWRHSTDLWEPDPAAPPNLIRGNFTAVAFDPGEPSRGYAVGQQGLLLGYGRQWTQEELPAGVPPEANFTSVTYAGGEALATWRFPRTDGTLRYEGGMISNDGSGWKVVPEPGALGTPVLVSGLPDGGAAVAFSEGEVAERENATSPWAMLPESAGGVPVALQAFREGGALRTLISIEPNSGVVGLSGSDREQIENPAVPGQPPVLTEAYPLPRDGYLERQTATGWRDEQHETFAVPSPLGSGAIDLPREPDPVLALLVAADGSGGWAVGGETGRRNQQNELLLQTASVMRYGAGAAGPTNFHPVPIPAGEGATIAFAGGAQCAGPCADQVGTAVGPEVWLPSAVAGAASVAGMRAFVYTGPGVASVAGEQLEPATRLGTQLSPTAFGREEDAYAGRLDANGTALPVYPTPSRTDLDRTGTLGAFASAFAPRTPVPQAELERGYYAFDTSGSGPPVRVVVLDYAGTSLGSAQDCWLAQELEGAKVIGAPAVVVGSRDLGGIDTKIAAPTDAAETVAILTAGTSPNLVASGCPLSAPAAASAYFFDFTEGNRTYRLASGGRSIPAFGSGTLGYVAPPSGRQDFTGAGGYLVASIGTPDPTTNVAPVGVRLIPDVGELALEASDGTLLRRSSAALFVGLARRPRAGGRCVGLSPGPQCESLSPDPYVPIPTECHGPNCATGIFPEYRFTSSNPDIANFVQTDPAGASHSVLLGANGKPIPDPTSGLLCAFNAGTTTVTVETGGFAYATQVTVQAGSVQRPCGTVPLANPKVTTPALGEPVTPLTNKSEPGFESPSSTLPPPPPPSPVPTSTVTPTTPTVVHLPKPVPPTSIPTFFAPAPVLTPVVVIVPPPPPPAVEPTPPSGTSPVTQPAFSPEPEEEEEAAFDLVHHAVVAPQAPRPAAAVGGIRGGEDRLIYTLPALALVAALAGGAVAGRRRRRAPEPAFLHSRR